MKRKLHNWVLLLLAGVLVSTSDTAAAEEGGEKPTFTIARVEQSTQCETPTVPMPCVLLTSMVRNVMAAKCRTGVCRETKTCALKARD